MDFYESQVVFEFARLWGRHEVKFWASTDVQARLLGNAQNDFDSLLADVAGNAGTRFFLIEFKRERKGFRQEAIAKSGKPHRQALYQHLQSDHTCRQLARFGHFGAYVNEDGSLVFEPYAHAVAAPAIRETIVRQTLGTDWHELDYQSFKISFTDFFWAVSCISDERYSQNVGLFKDGLGLPDESFKQYVACMYQHLESVEQPAGNCMLCIVDPSSKSVVRVMNSLDWLINKLHSAFEAVANIHDTNNKNSNDPSFSTPSP